MKDRSSITLRQRTLPSGRTTLYLDIICNGRRKVESLKLFLIPETSRADKQKNKETLKLAEAIRAKRVVEVQNKEFGFKSDFAEDTNFYDYYVAITEKRLGTESRGNWGNWRSCLKHMEKYDPNIKKRTFADITQDWVQGFRDYLEKEACAWGCDYRERIKDHPLSKNSKLSYFNKLRACLNQAMEERIIQTNPIVGVERFKEAEGTRMYLTIEEVKTLAQTECEYPNIKRAFLFSCLTGLRRSDVLRLKWGDIHKQDGYTRIIFTQKKTGGLEYLDISAQASELLGERGKPNENVFTDIHSPSCTNEAIKRWVLRAGINKEITFHGFRHSYAVIQISLGTDIYTVSKMLTHKSVSTTQIYADLVNIKKRETANKISLK